MVRAAMGIEEVVQIIPKQRSLKELSAKRAQVEKRQEHMAKRIVDTQKQLDSFTLKLKDVARVKTEITTELARRATELQKLDATEYKPTGFETMEVDQPLPQNLTEDQKNFWIEKQAEADAAKRAIQELATKSIAKRRCTRKTQPPEEIDHLEPPDPIWGPSQGSEEGKSAPPDIKILIAQADSAAALTKDAESRAFREEVEQQTAKT